MSRQIQKAQPDLIQKRAIVSGVHSYEEVMNEVKINLNELVQRNSMSQATAERIILEFEYTIFQQLVSIEYRSEQE